MTPEVTRRLGVAAWTVLGVALVAFLAGQVVLAVGLVVAPLVLALFPASLLAPVASRLRRWGLPPAVAALITLGGALAVLVGGLAALVPAFVSQAQPLAEALSDGIEAVDGWLPELPFVDVGSLSELVDTLGAQISAGDAGGSVLDRTIEAARRSAEIGAAAVLMLVVVFFYLKDGRRIADALLGFVPRSGRDHVGEVGDRVWDTVGRYFRGQLFVALVDAVFIGLGLWLLGVPLVVPLSVLVLVGGLFPIIGAFTSGLLAVLVALADGGLGTGLAALAIVIAVQQLEGNVLEPLILSKVIRLHPLVVITSIAVGALLLGILGAFLAVPVAAAVARVVEYVRERRGISPGGDEARTKGQEEEGQPSSSRRVAAQSGTPDR